MRSIQQLQIAPLLLVAFVLPVSIASAQVSKSPPRAAGSNASTTPKPAGVAARLSGVVASGHLDDLRWPDFTDYRSLLTSFYRASGYQPAWVANGEPTPQALELIRILQDADREGLLAEDYDASRWADRLTSLKGSHEDAAEARFDAALTVCIMRYVSDLQVGRINPQHLGFEFDISQKKLNLPQFVRQLVQGSDLRSELAEVGPPFEGYQRLRSALQHYMELAKSDSGEKLNYPSQASPGSWYSDTERLASRLRLLGDLPESATIPPDSKTYEGPVVDAVKHFQGRHGLNPTGELDNKTIGQLNVPLKDRVEQMRLGLERYRWLPYHFKQPPIVINVPEFRLYGFDKENRIGITMTVNVGDQYYFQTPMFEKDMLYVVFRPYWNPPPQILRNEIVRDLEENPSLEENDLELVGANGRVIKSGDVTGAMLQQVRAGKLSVRQPPGPENSLGLVKFMFPNKHFVYIHDTPKSQEKFFKKERAVSHGCIHAERPAELAAWVLRNNPDWNLERVDQAMHEGRDNVQVNLVSPIPVLIVYQTAVVEENGDVHFFSDIYAHDAALKQQLAEGYPYPR